VRLEITRRADLATRALLVLGEGRKLKGGQLAERLGASTGFLAQSMSPLVARGWVRSEPGPTGGYALATDLGEVSVLQVIEAVEGPTDASRCVLEDRLCTGGAPCALHQPWSRARALLLAELEATPVAAVAAAGAQP